MKHKRWIRNFGLQKHFKFLINESLNLNDLENEYNEDYINEFFNIKDILNIRSFLNLSNLTHYNKLKNQILPIEIWSIILINYEYSYNDLINLSRSCKLFRMIL